MKVLLERLATVRKCLQRSINLLAENADASRRAMLLMAVREERDTLKMRVQEIQTSPEIGTIAPAVNDAGALLLEIDQQFGYA